MPQRKRFFDALSALDESNAGVEIQALLQAAEELCACAVASRCPVCCPLYKILCESPYHSVFVFSRDRTVLAINETLGERLGIVPEAAVGHKTTEIVGDIGARSRFASLVEEAFDTGRIMTGIELSVNHQLIKFLLYPWKDGNAIVQRVMAVSFPVRIFEEVPVPAKSWNIVA